MPANLTPEYQQAEARYREATTPAEKLAALEEMLRTLPKHKGTEKMQADLKRKISQMRQAGGKKKSGGKDPYHIPPQGAGQVLLLGAPNTGKSSLMAALTDAPVKVAEFPFSTPLPVPGIAYHEDVPIELVDLPPITPQHVPGAMIGAIRNTHIVGVVGNLAHDTVLEDLDNVLRILAERHIELRSSAALPEGEPGGTAYKKGLVIATGCDQDAAADNLELVRELIADRLKIVVVSSTTRENLGGLVATLFELLHVVRVYAKPPGKEPDKSAPFVLAAGSTVLDLARHIHKELASEFKRARLWGEGAFPGQPVHHDHVLHDKDVVEIHM
jgi:ribosome-interacting GTPase 1